MPIGLPLTCRCAGSRSPFRKEDPKWFFGARSVSVEGAIPIRLRALEQPPAPLSRDGACVVRTPIPTDRLALSPAELTRVLPLSRASAYRLARKLGVRAGRKLLVPVSALQEWLTKAPRADGRGGES